MSIRRKIALLAGIPVLGTLILGLALAQHARTQTAAAAALGSIEDVAQLSVHISGLMRALQLERARTTLEEGFESREGHSATSDKLTRERDATDTAPFQDRKRRVAALPSSDPSAGLTVPHALL